jgi:hypothetical protein
VGASSFALTEDAAAKTKSRKRRTLGSSVPNNTVSPRVR